MERTTSINGDLGRRLWRGVSVLMSSNMQIKLESVNPASGILASDGRIVCCSEGLEQFARWDSLCCTLSRGPDGRH